MKKIKALFIGTGRKKPFVIEFEDKLENLQSLVGGYIEVFTLCSKENSEREIVLIFNEEGKFLFSKPNRTLVFSNGMFDPIMGNIIVVASDVGVEDFDSLTDEEINYYMDYFSQTHIELGDNL